MLRLYGGNTFALSSPLHLVSWITLRLSFPPAVSIDIWLLLFIKRWKKKPWKVLLTSAGVTHNLKKCEHVVRDNILIRRSFSITKRPTLKHNQDKPTSMFNRTPGGGVLLMMAYTGRLRPKGLPSFFRLQVYERVGASPRKHLLTTPPG